MSKTEDHDNIDSEHPDPNVDSYHYVIQEDGAFWFHVLFYRLYGHLLEDTGNMVMSWTPTWYIVSSW